MAKKKYTPRFPIAAPLVVGGTLITAWLCAMRPLTGTLGPESAQILATTCGPLLLFAAAERAAKGSDRGFLGDLRGTLALGLVAVVGFLLIVGIAGLSQESCAPGRGFAPYLVLTAPVLLLHSAIGTWLGTVIGRRRLAVLAGFLLLVAYVLFEVTSWIVDPSLRVLTHLSVLIEQDLFRGARFTDAQAFFRLATFLYALALCAAGAARFPKRKRGAGLGGSGPGGGSLYAIAFALFCAAITVDFYAEDKIAPSRDQLDVAYSLTLERGPLVLHANPDAFSLREASALLAEANLWLGRVDGRLGITTEKQIQIYLHKDRRAKRKWTGASNVDFALPTKRELHIANADVPHKTLGHEIAHIVAGDLAGGLFGVPTEWGIFPKPGLIEGLAMALTDELSVQGELTLKERAAALRRAKLAPDLKHLMTDSFSLFSFFFDHAMGNSYVVSGALIDDVLAHKGPEAIARAYAEGNLEAAFSDEPDPATATELFLKNHIANLDAMILPADAVYYVQKHYSKPSVLNETCNPERIEIARQIRHAAQRGQFADAETLATEADGELTAAVLGELARSAKDLHRQKRATAYFEMRAELRDTDDYGVIAGRLSDAGDALWKTGRQREALARWKRVREEKLSPGSMRLIQVKILLAEIRMAKSAGNRSAHLALEYLLLATDRQDAVPALLALSEHLASIEEPLSTANTAGAVARYLLMRNRLQRGDIETGLTMALDLYRDGDLLPDFLHEEVLRGIAIAHARRGDFAIAKEGFDQIATKTDRAALRIRMRDRAERATRVEAAKDSPHTDLKSGDRWLLGLGSQLSF